MHICLYCSGKNILWEKQIKIKTEKAFGLQGCVNLEYGIKQSHYKEFTQGAIFMETI